MKRLLLTGQKSFENRGCEAIVRGTVTLLREVYPSVEVLVPSVNPAADRAGWPDADMAGVRFVDAFSSPYAGPWVNLQRLPIASLKRAKWPFGIPSRVARHFDGVDGVLAVGGDNYSLDYRLPTPIMGMDAAAMNRGLPVGLWGASVGPFDAEPAFIPAVRDHLAKMAFITTRESESTAYLRSLGLRNVAQVTDPAFALEPQPVDLSGVLPHPHNDVLGLNVSPLIERYRKAHWRAGGLRHAVARFVEQVVGALDMSVLLVPHVIPANGSEANNDETYLAQILRMTNVPYGRVRLLRGSLNAAQLKSVIGACRFFIGARTHATIAALSSGVPTISISYSVKAVGINRDLFGSARYVLPTTDVSCESLIAHLTVLMQEESAIRKLLEAQREPWRRAASSAVAMLEAF